MSSKWVYAYASVPGVSHLQSGRPCQDASLCEVFIGPNDSSTLLAIVSDGAGSAARADFAASLACESFNLHVQTFLQGGNTLGRLDRGVVANWLMAIADELREIAAREQRPVRDFSTTLVAALIDNETAVYVQVGDGCIVVPDRDVAEDYCWIFWPDNGEYINETYFLTDPSLLERFQFECGAALGQVAVMTDGVQPIALHYASRSAHSKFFASMFASLAGISPGYQLTRSDSLASFLASDRVCERTDDDKSLVLARRE